MARENGVRARGDRASPRHVGGWVASCAPSRANGAPRDGAACPRVPPLRAYGAAPPREGTPLAREWGGVPPRAPSPTYRAARSKGKGRGRWRRGGLGGGVAPACPFPARTGGAAEGEGRGWGRRGRRDSRAPSARTGRRALVQPPLGPGRRALACPLPRVRGVRSRKERGRGRYAVRPSSNAEGWGGGVPSRTGGGRGGPDGDGERGGVPLVRTSSAQMGRGREWRTFACNPSRAYGAACPRTPPSARMGKGAGVACPHVKGGGQGEGEGPGQRGEGGVPLCALSAAKGKGGTGGNGKGGDHPFRANGEGRRRRSSREWEGTGREEGEGAVAGALMRTSSCEWAARTGEREGRRRGTADPRAPPFRKRGSGVPLRRPSTRRDSGAWGDGRGPEGGTACPRAPHFYANGVARTGGRVGA
ncbi:hypothetical protein EDB85DRAFT_2245706, partial [Lactarius pseudohatsudake]